MNAQEIEKARALLENFNQCIEPIQEKILVCVKNLAFLYDLANDDRSTKPAPLSSKE